MVADITSFFAPGQVLTPADGQAYEDNIQRWADNAVRRAQFVVLAESAQDVSKAIVFAVSNNLEFAIAGGRHSTSGASSSTGLVVDLRKMNGVAVDTEKMLLTVAGGAVWADVDLAASQYALATVGGTVNHTGVGGLTVGGGYGWLTPKYGLTIDNLVGAEVVTASGAIVNCSEAENADLFWAIRGGGSNFGAVTAFVLKAYPQPNTIWSGMLIYTPPQLEAVAAAAAIWAAGAGVDESAMVALISPPPAHQPTIGALPFFNGTEEEGRRRFKAFFDVGPLLDLTRVMPYVEMNGSLNAMTTHGNRKVIKSISFSLLQPAFVRSLFDKYVQLVAAHPEAAMTSILFELHNTDKLCSVPNDAMAFANRGLWYNLSLVMRWKNPALDDTMRAWTHEISDFVAAAEAADPNSPVRPNRGYANFADADERVQDVFGTNYARLAQIKGKYDPQNVFNKWFPITPATN